MTFIKKLLLATVIILGTVTAGFAQEVEGAGDYKAGVHDEDRSMGWVYTTNVTAIKGAVQPEDMTIYYYGDRKAVRFFLFYPKGAGFNSNQTVELILNGDKSTYASGDGVLSRAGNLIIQNAINNLGIQSLYSEGESLYVKIGGNITKISLNGLTDALNRVIEVVDGRMTDNPFGGDNGNPFGGGENTINNSQEWVDYYGIESLNPFNLESYLEVFLSDAEDNGIDVSHVRNGEISFEFKIDPRVGPETIAYTDTLGDDNRVHVVVNPTRWNQASQAKRLAILYHELGHDILNFEHNSEEGPLMSVYARADYSYEDLFELKNEMFNDFKNGVVYKIN